MMVSRSLVSSCAAEGFSAQRAVAAAVVMSAASVPAAHASDTAASRLPPQATLHRIARAAPVSFFLESRP